MIKKERKVPLKILKLQALLRRLPQNHPKRAKIEDELSRRTAGYKGEQSTDYYLSFLPEKNYYILHDLRLPTNSHYFQLDTVILSPYYVLILEVKNFAGQLFFDDTFNQLIRTINGKEEGFPDPIIQMKMHQNLFEKWLSQNKFSNIPIESLVVISNDYAIIKAPAKNPYYLRPVIHSNKLPFKFEEFTKQYPSPRIPEKELKRLISLLIRKNTPHSSSILDTFNLTRADIVRGVQCPVCSIIPMSRKKGAWHCPQCDHTSKDAHLAALHDYALLVSDTITNHDLRYFLQLSSRSTALTILNTMHLKSEGDNKGKVYYLPTF